MYIGKPQRIVTAVPLPRPERIVAPQYDPKPVEQPAQPPVRQAEPVRVGLYSLRG